MKNKLSKYVQKRLSEGLEKQEKQKFTPEQQACISRNIPKKLEEGMSRDQAIAASISICAPDVEREEKERLKALSHDSAKADLFLEKALVDYWKRIHPGDYSPR